MLAIELYEAGVIDDGDLDGLRLEWGNTEAILEVMDAIVHKRGFGEILALGPGKMLSAIGRGAEAYAVDYKNGLVGQPLKHTNTLNCLCVASRIFALYIAKRRNTRKNNAGSGSRFELSFRL